ncbi:MAG TPA: ABC transporter ATP-binding protein [Acidimicrobiales bacterium]|nr:ABC transporter ATP-binding protein [Acidimicrobiales bacterium]
MAYGERIAVDGISFTAGAGEVLALLGPNGAGKTTTVETLEGYRRPGSGRVRVLGLDPVGDHRALVSRIGVMLQQAGIYPMLNARQALRLFASYYEQPRDGGELIELLGLGSVATTPFKRLSGGEQQRLALALALLGRPEVVFLDEPTSGVDPAGRLAVRAVIAAVRDAGACVVLTSHELDEVERLADRIVIIDEGRVVAAGTHGEIGSGSEDIRFSAPAGMDLAELTGALGVAVSEGPAGEYRVAAVPTPALLAALTSWMAERDVTLSSLRAGRERLEDLFLRLVSERDRTA